MIKQCLICGKDFETIPHGESRKYCFDCSPSHDKGDSQGRAQTITAIRHALKKELIKRKGGKCEKCGYDKCQASLEFHHLNPNEKEFNIGSYCSGNNVKVQAAFDKLEKCVLLCSNCHHEFHYLEAKDHITYEDYLKI